MPDPNSFFSRRAFLGNTLKLGAGSLLLGAAVPENAGAKETGSKLKTDFPAPANLSEPPVRVFVQHEDERLRPADRHGARFTSDQAEVNFVQDANGLAVRVVCPGGPLSRVVLRWEMTFPDDTVFLGDHWEEPFGTNPLRV